MNIAILSCFYPYRGGIAQFNANLFNELSANHVVTAFNFKRQYPEFLFPGKSQYVEDGDSAIRIESRALLDTINPLSYISTAKEIRKLDPDLLIMRYWMSYFSPSQGFIGRHVGKRCKVISIVDNAIPHEPHIWDRPLTKYFIGANDGIVVLSDSVGKELSQFGKNIRYICSPHPLYNHFGTKVERESACARLGLDSNKKIVLFFGLIREYKGLDTLIEAFSKLDNSYQLIIAGEPYGSFAPYQKLIEASPNMENIKLFLNFIPDSEVPLFFSAADVCLLPYKTATQSGIGAISLHFDLPMITTDVGGLRESIEKPGTGIVVKAEDPDAICIALSQFFTSGNRAMFVNNIETVKKRLTWNNFANDLIDFYNTL